MKICIYGAGATGGHFAVKLARAGHEVSVIARGGHLAAIQANGLTLIAGEATLNARVTATDDAATLSLQDLIVVTVKATALDDIAEALAKIVGPDTLVAFPQNGMSWWYPLGLDPSKPTPPDIPLFRIAKSFEPFLATEQIIGGSIYSGNEVIEPGVIKNSSPHRNGLSLGRIAPGDDTRLTAIRAALNEAGIASPDVPDIRAIIWSKLLVNMTGSALALATENQSSISRKDLALGAIYLRAVHEGLAIAKAHGYDLTGQIVPETLQANLLDHKPSILQDYERGRPMELAEIVEAPLAFARSAGVETPIMDTISAIVGRKARDKGLV